MIDELSGEIGESHANGDLAIGREIDGIPPAMRLHGLAVERDHLKVIDVDMEWVPVGAGISNNPFLEMSQLDRLVDPIGIPVLPVDREEEWGAGFLESGHPLAIDFQEAQVLEGDESRGKLTRFKDIASTTIVASSTSGCA